MMQLACAYTRLALPHSLDVVSDLLTLSPALIVSAVALVIGLTTDAQKLASPDDAQSFDLALREDLPGRFFTIETP